MRNTLVRALALAAVAWMAGLGCGGGEVQEPAVETGSTEQEIQACDPYNPYCNTGTTCVRGSCLRSCDPEDPVCPLGQTCCVEYIPPGGPVVMPYCTKYCPR